MAFLKDCLSTFCEKIAHLLLQLCCLKVWSSGSRPSTLGWRLFESLLFQVQGCDSCRQCFLECKAAIPAEIASQKAGAIPQRLSFHHRGGGSYRDSLSTVTEAMSARPDTYRSTCKGKGRCKGPCAPTCTETCRWSCGMFSAVRLFDATTGAFRA